MCLRNFDRYNFHDTFVQKYRQEYNNVFIFVTIYCKTLESQNTIF